MKVQKEEDWKVSQLNEMLFIIKHYKTAVLIYKWNYFPQKVIPGDWEKSVDPGEEEGKVLMKILPERKRWKTGNFGLVGPVKSNSY